MIGVPLDPLCKVQHYIDRIPDDCRCDAYIAVRRAERRRLRDVLQDAYRDARPPGAPTKDDRVRMAAALDLLILVTMESQQ